MATLGKVLLILGTLLALLAALSARADDGCGCEPAPGKACVTWTQPTLDADNQALETLGVPGYVSGNGVYRATRADLADLRLVAALARTTCYADAGLADGTYYYVVTAVNSKGESAGVRALPYTVSAARPPPTRRYLVRDDAPQVYTVVKQTNKFVLAVVGTVSPGTPCDATHEVNGYRVVDRAAVTWVGTVKPYVVVARCRDALAAE